MRGRKTIFPLDQPVIVCKTDLSMAKYCFSTQRVVPKWKISFGVEIYIVGWQNQLIDLKQTGLSN